MNERTIVGWCADMVLAASIGIALGAVTGAVMMIVLLVVRRK